MPLISIVDDDLSVRRALRRVLQAAGYTVDVFASADDFLASSPGSRTACLVLDIHMDGVTGFELQERMAADGTGIPVIFITAHDDASTRERVQRAGVAAYLPKPFSASALLAAIQQVLDSTPSDGLTLTGTDAAP